MTLYSNNYAQLKHFIEELRHFSDKSTETFNERVKQLLLQKSDDTIFKKELTDFCFTTLDNTYFVNAFSDYGINSNGGFFSEIAKRIKHKILPNNIPENEFSHFINFIFNNPKDYLWLEKFNSSNWEILINLIDANQLSAYSEKLVQQLCDAIIILCHRLTTIGIDPYLANKLPETINSNSSFFKLNHQLSLFVKKYSENKNSEINHIELQNIILLLNQAEQLFIDLQAKKDKIGTSLNLTFLLKRAQQHFDRIRLLLNLVTTKQDNNKTPSVSKLIKELAKAEHTKNSVRKLIKENTSMLAYRIVSHTSEKGEHYIGFSKKENQTLFRSALGGGLVVIFLVYIKHLIHGLHLSLFFEGVLFGLNYGLGFVFMHLTHLTLATKQPAMTASFIAESIDNGNNSGKKPWLMFQQIIRSQLISLIGNLAIVLPFCFLSAWLLYHYSNYSVFDTAESNAHLYSNHPFYSGSLIYAFITGIFLSLSGLVIGYIDNKVVYSEISERIVKHSSLIKIYSLEKRKKIAAFTEKNLGAIIGNLFLGFCLGMAGNIGKFIGLPFDIRHVTISSGNFAIAAGSEASFSLDLIITVFVGVIIIGLINIASSFLISFVLACRSRNLSGKESLKILVGLSK